VLLPPQLLHDAETVGPTSDPHVLLGGGGGGGLDPPSGVGEPGPTGTPHTSPVGTQTLTWSPLYALTVEHMRPAEHELSAPHGGAQ
jgi:hypothetical protein